MTTRYQLPAALGGGEAPGRRIGARGDVQIEVPGVGKVTMPAKAVTEIPLPTRPEPEGEFFLWERPSSNLLPRCVLHRTAWGWAYVGGNAKGGGPYTWQDMATRIKPEDTLTLLVPDPYAIVGELPWRNAEAATEVNAAIGCACHGQPDGAPLIHDTVGESTATLDPATARAKAYALLTAANQAEAGHK